MFLTSTISGFIKAVVIAFVAGFFTGIIFMLWLLF